MLSSFVANGFDTMTTLQVSTTDPTETTKFCQMFDKFFNIFNTRAINEHTIKKKPNLKPYYEKHDKRLKVIINS